MKGTRFTLTGLALALLSVILGYAVYLAAGGPIGREELKAQIAIFRADASHEIGARDGEDCHLVGTWEGDTSTCRLTSDAPVGSRFFISSDGVTLDGAGHTLRGSGTGIAVQVIDRSGVTIRDMSISGYNEGVLVQHSERVTLRGLVVEHTIEHAIRLTGLANFNRVLENRLGPTSPLGHGVALWSSHGNLIASNVIVATRDAVRLQTSVGNSVLQNFTYRSMIEGIDLHRSSGNTVAHNDLMEATALPLLDDAPPGANVYSLNDGGNHYAQYYRPDQGCVDEVGDGFCDDPYRFFSANLDLKPSVGQWTKIRTSDPAVADRAMASSSPVSACGGCHMLGVSVDDDMAVVGPDIRSIVGRPIASDEAFEYSDALASMDGVWTEEALHSFLENPQSFAPGTSMVGISVLEVEARQMIIDHLASLSR